MLFKGCSVVIQVCKQCNIQGTSISIQEYTDCGQCGEMLRDLTHRTQTASWQHIDLFLQCHSISMCVPLFVCRDICIWICLNMSCEMLVVFGKGRTASWDYETLFYVTVVLVRRFKMKRLPFRCVETQTFVL
jgi:hypothetical protein